MARPRIIDGDESVKMTVSVSMATAETMSRLARESGHSLAALIRQAITHYLEGRDA